MAYTALEPRVRHLVADTLGVGVEELRPEVSLTDDLAADSLDLAELFARLETELGVVLGDRLVESLRTYGDLVRATVAEAPAPSTHNPMVLEIILVRSIRDWAPATDPCT